MTYLKVCKKEACNKCKNIGKRIEEDKKINKEEALKKLDLLFEAYEWEKSIIDSSKWNFTKIKNRFDCYDLFQWEYNHKINSDLYGYIERNIFKDEYEITDINKNLKSALITLAGVSSFSHIFRILEIATNLFHKKHLKESDELERQQKYFNF